MSTLPATQQEVTTTQTVKFRNYTPAHGRINEQKLFKTKKNHLLKVETRGTTPSRLGTSSQRAKAEASVSATVQVTVIQLCNKRAI
jgi:hypothetical protein